MLGVPPRPYGTAFGGGGVSSSSTLEGREMIRCGLSFVNSGISFASGGGGGGLGTGSDLYRPFDSSTTRLVVTVSGRGKGTPLIPPTNLTEIETLTGPPQL